MHDSLLAQQKQIIEQQARNELQKRDVTEDELRAKLAEKGVDLDELSKLDPAQAAQMQSTIEQAIKEIEESKAKLVNKTPSAVSTNVKVSPTSIDNAKENKPIDAKVGGINKNATADEGKLLENTDSIAIWGQHLFRNKSLALFRQSNNIKPPDTYILGVEDQVTVAIWGLSQLNQSYEINAEGYIVPERMPRIFLKGISLGKAKLMLKNYFKQYYRFGDNDFQVSLNYSRNINVNIFGEVYQYGGFTIPAINTAFNAIIAAGGPTNIGSVRKIKLYRNGIEKKIDVYKFIENPKLDQDFYLENNDIIQVPVADKIVSIRGAINRPFQYELLDNEGLKKLIEYAGGLSANAIQKTIQVERIKSDKRIIIDVPYADLVSKNGDFTIEKGDIVTVHRIITSTENYVRVFGEVRVESKFQFDDKMKLSDIIQKIQFTENSNLNNAFILRQNTDRTVALIMVNLKKVLSGDATANIDLKPKDEIRIYGQNYFVDKTFISVNGSVRSPGKYEYQVNQNLKINDIISYSGGLKPEAWQYAYLFRKKSEIDNELTVIRVNVVDATNNQNSDQNITMQAFDSLVIISENEFMATMTVDVRGAVQKPGKFNYSKGLSLKDAITLSGGFDFSAASNRIEIFRIIIKDNQPTQTIAKSITTSKALDDLDANGNFRLDPYDIVVVRAQPAFEFQKLVTITGEVRYPGPYALLDPNEKIVDIINRAGGFSSEAFPEGATLYRNKDKVGYVILDLQSAIKSKNSRYNFILKEEDQIFIPKRKDLVSISGATNVAELYPEKLIATNNTITVAYYKGKNAKFYIEKYAAGLSKNADPNKITVEHPNGKVSKTQHYLFFKIYPKVDKGSVVNVGSKDIKTSKEKKNGKEIDWGKVVSDSLAQLTAVLSIYLLIDRIN